MERKATECTPPNIGCSAGYVCDVTTYKCIQQVGPGNFCGDGYCDRTKENNDNCPADCGERIWDKFLDYLKLFLAGLVVSGIILALLVVALPMAYPPLALFTFLRKPKLLLIAWVLLAVVLMLMFSIPLGQIASMVIR